MQVMGVCLVPLVVWVTQELPLTVIAQLELAMACALSAPNSAGKLGKPRPSNQTPDSHHARLLLYHLNSLN